MAYLDCATEAESCCRRIVELGIEQPKVYLNIGNVLFALNQMYIAAESYRRALELDPHLISANYFQAIFSYDLSSQLRQNIIFCRALELQPGDIVHTASYDQVRRPIYSNSVGRSKNYERHFESVKRALSAPEF